MLDANQIKALERLQTLRAFIDGIADECHEYYCPCNIEVILGNMDGQDANIVNANVGGRVAYSGAPDGFDSPCPRFFPIDRTKGKWKCLNMLEVVATLLKIDTIKLYRELRPYFKKEGKSDFPEILGYNPRWRHETKKIGKGG
jgi:hypothetical protein